MITYPLLLVLACSPLKDSGTTPGDGGGSVTGDGGGSVTGDGGGSVTGDGGTQDLSMPDFVLVDLNPGSPRHGQSVSPRDYLEQVSGWYFTHAS